MAVEAIGEKVPGKDSSGPERRRSVRYRCEGYAEAVVLQPESLFRGDILDISLTGCFVRTRARLNVERLSRIELRFRLNNHPCHAFAQIMDIRPGKGVGVEFLFDSAEPELWLRELILEFYAAEQKKKPKTPAF